ncbi:MAG: leucine-rich repeat protein [Oscillospiraceae bacterium]|nr:leucine-rich repeat protein [Oscillospiraceae bacterium]
MRKTVQKALSAVLCLALLLSLAPAAMAAAYRTEPVDADVITGFDSPDLTIDTDYKLALVELKKRFPAELTVMLGGTLSYDRDGTLLDAAPAVTESIAVTWECLEDYDEDLDVFHFVPALDLRLAEGVKLPVVTVNIRGELEIPQLVTSMPEETYTFGSAESGSEAGANLPESYNGYELGLLPPIRNQNPFNTCWAFATIAAVEADMIHDGLAGTDVDLSELHLVYFTYHQYFDEKGCNTGDTITLNGQDYLRCGGSNIYSTMAVTNLIGPVDEAVVPYSLAYDYQPSAVEGRAGDIQITNAYHYEKDNIAGIKQAILDHGAVNAIYYSDGALYSPTYNSYYYSGPSKTNHSVALVGWDDSFSRNHFKSGTPASDGAWLVRNSWGTNEYGYGGYFWLSYYDTGLYSMMYAFDVQPWRYDHCYSYDNAPNRWWWRADSGSAIGQAFKVDDDEVIEAVGVYCQTGNTDLRFTVSCGTMSSTADLHIGVPGYYVLPLTEPLVTVEKSAVDVQYVITGSDSQVRVNSEGPLTYSGYSGNTGYSILFNADRGSGLIINGDLKDKDARIKLFTNDSMTPIDPDLVLPADLTEIGSEAFRKAACTYVMLSDKVTAIGARAFADCPNLAFVHIPAATTDISPDAFSGTQDLTILGQAGSYAETYANEHGFGFMPVVE